MNLLLKWGIRLIALCVLILVVGAVWLWKAPLPNYDWALNRAFFKFALMSPETLSGLRILEPYGIKFHQDELDDSSIAAGDEALALLKATSDELGEFNRADLTYQQQLSYDMVEWMKVRLVEGADKWRYHDYPVNQLFGVQSGFPSFMESQHAIDSLGDAEDYNRRLGKVGIKFDQVLEGLRMREEKGILPPTFVVDRVLEEMIGFKDTAIDENILASNFAKKIKKAGINEAEQKRLIEENHRQIEEVVYPAYQALIDYFTAVRPKTTQDDGVWKFPNGDEFYEYILQVNTTSEMTPEEIHQLGLAEVERIHGEMRAIFTEQGYAEDVPVGQLMDNLGKEERFLYPDNDEGRAQILVDYQNIIDEINAGLDPWFSVKPKASVKVERIPQFKEKTSPAAYYNQPAMDGSRPGIFYANLYDISATRKFRMRTLAYHEAIPGHHFQIAIAQERPDLPMFRRMSPFTAYAEGWALYSERVAWEAGFQNDPFDNLGRLQDELLRAVRLVVDTGLHYKRWTREQAIEYMFENTGMAMSDVVAEIERYIVLPGQACAYKVGMIQIQQLRSEAEAALGERFDVRAYHDLVLQNGAMPLVVLAQSVRDWIAKQK